MIIDSIIGGVAGMISRTCIAPIELKRIQKQNSFIPNSTLKDVLKKEGLRYLWKGNGVNCVRIFPQAAINYGVFRQTKNVLAKVIDNKNTLNFISGCNAGLVSMITIYPLETTRTYLSLQTNKNKYKGILDALKRIPVKQLYQGSKISLIGFGGYSGIKYTSYYYTNAFIKDTYFESNFVGGALAGLTAVSITYPSDLIRRRLQLQGFDASVPKYNGIIDSIRKIFKYEGIMGFYKGLGITYLKTIPAAGIQFWVIEKLNKIFKNEDIYI
jgi:solute carrier family 25 (mitochondrial phosphate transporter), member 23/24/25/41